MTYKMDVWPSSVYNRILTVIEHIAETYRDDQYPCIIIINVDKPDRKITSHDLNCKWVKKAKATSLKGVGEIRRDGGWMFFTSVADAQSFCETSFPRYTVKTCGVCIKK